MAEPHNSTTNPSVADLPVPRRKSPLRLAVPLVLFVLIIGGIAWVSQNMPSWRPKAVAPESPKGQEALLGFLHPQKEPGNFMAFWEVPKKTDKQPYAREFVEGAEGRYLFPCQVLSDQPVEVGMAFRSCDCAKMHVAVIGTQEADAMAKDLGSNPSQDNFDESGWDWKLLDKGDDRGVTLPAKAKVVFRMSWTNRRRPGESLNLNARVWARVGQRQEYALTVPAVCTLPIRAQTGRADIGLLNLGGTIKKEFLLWSPLYEKLDLAFEPANDPLLDVVTRKFTPAECEALQLKLRSEDVNTRVLAAWTVTVTVYEQRGNIQLDQGHFIRSLSFVLPPQIVVPEIAEKMPPLIITGYNRGEIIIGAADDQGRINLNSFDSKLGTSKTVFLWSGPKTELILDDVKPTSLDVAFAELPKEASATRRKWSLKVVVPPDQLFGLLTEENAVILRTNAVPPLRIRIPLMGNAFQR